MQSEDAGTVAGGIALLFLGLGGGFLFSYVPHRASLHRAYRDRLKSCFAVRREGNKAVGVEETLLSALAPPEDPQYGFPRLLVCATANVRHSGQAFVPFVLSHDVCGVPGSAGASFPSRKLELVSEPAGLLTKAREPLLSLFSAVATTGAAVSPSMGRYTYPSMRGLMAAANFRLGRWFPNPFRASIRDAVLAMTAPGSPYKRTVLGPGYDELVPEMLGLDGPRIYLSDGGHFDNLGLLALLRAKCAEIWCLDASPEPRGQAEELARLVDLAREELNIVIEVELGAFQATPEGLYHSTHAFGTITYPDGSLGQLIVVKLGLTRDSSAGLLERSRSEPKFPHHPTIRQMYDRSRMNAYREVGRDCALRCLTNFEEPR